MLRVILNLCFFLFFQFSAQAKVLWQWNEHGRANVLTMEWMEENGPKLVVATNGEEANLHLLDLSQKRRLWGVRATTDTTAASSSYGDRNVVLTEDINQDGKRDILWGTAWASRVLFAVDSASGGFLWKMDSYNNPRSDENGWILETKLFPDITQDGIPEVVFSVGEKDKSIYLANGYSGEIIWRYELFYTSSTALAVVEDIDGDGVSEVAVGTGSYDGRVLMISGRTGAVDTLWERDLDATVYDMTTVADLDEDGIKEVVLTDWRGRVYCVSGKSGAVLWSHYVGTILMKVITTDDLNGDSVPDVVITHASNSVLALNGKTGAEHFRSFAGAQSNYIWASDSISDINADGVEDVVVGTFGGQVIVYSGEDGSKLFEEKVGDSKVLTVRSLPDLNGDGLAEIAAGTQALHNRDLSGAGTLFVLTTKKEL